MDMLASVHQQILRKVAGKATDPQWCKYVTTQQYNYIPKASIFFYKIVSVRYESTKETVIHKQEKEQATNLSGASGLILHEKDFKITIIISVKMRLVYRKKKNLITTPHQIKLSRHKNKEA